MIRVIDGKKAASFDGMVLEVFGVSGSAESKRVLITALEALTLADAGGEPMLVVKTAKGGFGLAVSAERREEWRGFVADVLRAKSAL